MNVVRSKLLFDKLSSVTPLPKQFKAEDQQIRKTSRSYLNKNNKLNKIAGSHI